MSFETPNLEYLVNGIIIISFFEIIALCVLLKNIDKIIEYQVFFLNILAGIFLLLAFASAISEKSSFYSISFLFFSGVCHLRCLINFLKEVKKNE